MDAHIGIFTLIFVEFVKTIYSGEKNEKKYDMFIVMSNLSKCKCPKKIT